MSHTIESNCQRQGYIGAALLILDRVTDTEDEEVNTIVNDAINRLFQAENVLNARIRADEQRGD